jgi:membrane fusion protein (multidrug efflux system)
MVEMPRHQSFEEATESPKTSGVLPPNGVSPRRKLRRTLLGLVAISGAIGGSYFGYDYWTIGRFLESTDDAYVKADYTPVAPKVAGYISEVHVEDNQDVKVGQVLARIDDRDYRAALDQANAELNAATAAISNLYAQLTLQHSLVDQAKAAMEATRASLVFANEDAERYRTLEQTGAGTVQRAQQTEAARGTLTAQFARDQAGYIAEQRKIGVLTTARQQAQAQRERSHALAHQAELNLSYTTIIAPVDGNVGARSLRLGQYVTAGTQLMAIVPLSATYIVANFKETQLTYVRRGQSVEIRVDSFPDLRVRGKVNSLSPASGLEFSLLPPDNATGNFTKIVQRIPVKITLDGSRSTDLLRAGMSVEPTINTKSAARETSGGLP